MHIYIVFQFLMMNLMCQLESESDCPKALNACSWLKFTVKSISPRDSVLSYATPDQRGQTLTSVVFYSAVSFQLYTCWAPMVEDHCFKGMILHTSSFWTSACMRNMGGADWNIHCWTPPQTDSVCLGWRPMICISNKFHVMLMLLVRRPRFENYCSLL